MPTPLPCAITITTREGLPSSSSAPPGTHGGSDQELLATFREILIDSTGRKLCYLDLLATFLTLTEEDDRYGPHLCQLRLLAGEIARDTDFLITIGGLLNHAYIA